MSDIPPTTGGSSLPPSNQGTTDSIINFTSNDNENSIKTEIEDKKPKDDSKSRENQNPKIEPKIDFRCEKCDLHELCDYEGMKPPFVNGVIFAENCFVMRDPFAPPPFRSRSKPEYFIVVGAHCNVCGKIVCKRSKCSVFYGKTYCTDCALRNLKEFPSEMQAKFRKQLSD